MLKKMESANHLPEPETNNMQTNDQDKVVPSLSTSVAQEDVKSSSDEQTVKLQVITADIRREAFFNVRPKASIKRLKTKYCNVTRFKAKDIHFTYKNHRITDQDTAETLGMQSGDIIIVQMNCDKQCNCNKY